MKYLRYVIWLFCLVLLISCGGKSSSVNAPSNPVQDLSLLGISTPYYLPNDSSVRTDGYVYLYNNSNTSLTNLNYTISNNITNTSITLGANQCNSIAPNNSCALYFSFLRTTNTGGFSIQVSNGSSIVTSDVIGISKVNTTSLSGADGIKLISVPYVITNRNGLETRVVVSALVNSSSIGSDFNTIKLTDSSGSKLDYVVLNSKNGVESLTQGYMVTFALSLPSSTAIMPIYAQIGNTIDGIYTAIDTSTTFITVTQLSSTSILNLIPQNAVLSTSNESQVFTIYNAGNQTSISFTLVLTSLNGISTAGNTCTGILPPKSSCSYTTSFSPNTMFGTYNTILSVAYSGGVADNYVSDVTYKGVGHYGLMISSEKDHFSTMIGQAESSLLTITNTGTVDESNIQLAVSNSNLFTFSQSNQSDSCMLSGDVISNNIAPGYFCTIVLTYQANQVESEQSTSVSVAYYYNGVDILRSIINFNYLTVEKYPIIQVSPRYVHYPILAADNFESSLAVFTVNNYGYQSTSDLAINFLSNENNIFTIVYNNCSQVLGANDSCSFAVLAGPTSDGGSYSGSIDVSYQNKHEIESLAVEFYSLKSFDINLLVLKDNKFGGNGVESSPFVLPYAEVGTITLRYMNIGSESAVNFTVTLPASGVIGYTLVSNNCQDKLLGHNDYCDVTFDTIDYYVGSYNINLNDIFYATRDQQSVASSWNGNSQVYVSFLPAVPVGLNSFAIIYNGDSYPGTFESANQLITIVLPQNTYQYTNQESASFVSQFSTASSLDEVYVDGAIQSSGISSQNFWNKIRYTVKAFKGQAVSYDVYVFCWNTLPAIPSSYPPSALATDESGNIYAGDTNPDLFVYIAENQTWNTIQINFSDDYGGVTTIAPIDTSSVYAGTAALFGGHEYFVTTSGGAKSINTFHEGAKFPYSSFYSADLPSNITPLYGDSLGNLWAGDGSLVYDTSSYGNVVSVIYSNGNIWFAIAFSGPNNDGYIYYCNTSLSCNRVDSGSNTYVTADESGNAYAAWASSGQIIKYVENNGVESSNAIYSIPNACLGSPHYCMPQILYDNNNQLLFYLYYNNNIGYDGPVLNFGVVTVDGNVPVSLPYPPQNVLRQYPIAIDALNSNIIFMGSDLLFHWMHYPN
ncbi:MAG: hypothetical protein K2X04_09415 [Burkholderiales bacterium]|nr:hypothetical protein [Burkholderiales bacterium]